MFNYERLKYRLGHNLIEKKDGINDRIYGKMHNRRLILNLVDYAFIIYTNTL